MKTLLVMVLVAAGCSTPQGAAQDAATTGWFYRSTPCALDCPKPAAFQYTNNMVHVFDYHASVRFLSGSREPQLGVSARAHVTVAGPCEMILAMSHVRLADSSHTSEQFAASLSQHPLRFGFADGRVTSVCPSEGEPRWTLNIKRALLSLFQNSMGDMKKLKPGVMSEPLVVMETDVSGECTSNYTAVAGEGGLLNVTRIRASSCVAPPLPPSPLACDSFLQMLPLLNREQKCLQMISGGTLKEAVCRENFRYSELLSDSDDPSVTSITASLKLVYQFKADFVVVPNYRAMRRSLAMEWEDPAKDEPSSDWFDTVQTILRSLSDLRLHPTLFSQLTDILRRLNYDQISQMIIDLSPDLWDMASMAVIKLGTEPSMKFFLDLLNDDSSYHYALNDVADYIIRKFEMNSPMIDIIKNRIPYGITDLMKRKLKGYCVENMDCAQDQRIQDIINAVLLYSEPECQVAAENGTSLIIDHYKSMMSINSLESWRDIGRRPENSTAALDVCILSPTSEEQYVALEALRNVPCDSYDYEDLLRMVKENTIGSYMQIMMYRTLIRCPTSDLQTFLFQKLTSDPINQVTSFIWTHLSNARHIAWANELVNDSNLKSKFIESALKFSRNFITDFIVGNNTISIDLDIIVSDFSLKPEFISFRVFSEEIDPLDLFEFEARVKNVTRENYSYSHSTEVERNITTYNDSTCVVTINAMGYNIYYTENWSSDYDVSFFYGYFAVVAEKFFELMTVKYFINFFVTPIFSVEYKNIDFNILYPTSVGMPFHLKLNLTKGMSSKNLFPAHAKQLDGIMFIDATHTNVGTKFELKCSALPGLNFSIVDGAYELLVRMPETVTTLVDVDFGIYNIENNKLTPRFNRNETAQSSVCIPGLKDFSGSTLCFNYCPKAKWWPIYNLKYSLVYDRDIDTLGYNLTGRLNKTTLDVNLEPIGVPERGWRVTYSELAHFVNAKVFTPYFSLNGSGTFNKTVLNFDGSGNAVNMTGLLSCDNKTASFTLTGESILNDNSNKSSLNVYFYSSIFETQIISAYQIGDNCSYDVTIPYRVDGGKSESVRFLASSDNFEVTSAMRSNYKTALPTSFNRTVYSSSMAFSAYPGTVFSLDAICDDEEGRNSTDTFTANLEVTTTTKQLVGIVSVLDNPVNRDYNCSFHYESPDDIVVWNKTVHIGDGNSRIMSSLTNNNHVVYTAEADAGVTTSLGYYGIGSFVVPCWETDPLYPVLNITFDGNVNVLNQHVHLHCLRTYYDKSFKLNITADALADKNGVPLGFGEFTRHHAVFEVSVNNRDQLLLTGATQLSNSLEDFDLTLALETPFTRWDKEALKLKLKKKGHHLKTTLTENRKNKSPLIYSIEGTTENDIASALDFSTHPILEDFKKSYSKTIK